MFSSDSDGSARFTLFSVLGGVIFGAGWWCLIDGFASGSFANDSASKAAQGYAWLPCFFASLAYLGINGMSWSELRDDSGFSGNTATKARMFLLLMLLILMACIVGAAFIMVNQFLSVTGTYAWAGISCLVGTLLITLGAFVQRFGTLPA